MKLLALFLFALLSSACFIGPPPPCGPGTCSGCCNGGVCVSGGANNACGAAGQACAICAGGTQCLSGSCFVNNVGGGSGGGGATGGGSGGGGAMGQRGNVTFLWNFSGQTCSQAGVGNVRITIPGETLMNGGVFGCTTAGTQGIVLADFAPRSYTFTIEGFNGSTLTWQGQGNFTVNGNVNVPVTLSPVSSMGNARLFWSFPPNSASQTPTCAQAGVSDVLIGIDSQTPYTVACSEGQSANGSPTPQLASGTHSLTYSATNAQGYAYYDFGGTLSITAGTTTNSSNLMNWAVGGATVRWTVTSGGTTISCASAGIADVYVNFRDSAGQFLYSGAGDPQPCAAGSVVYSFLKPGNLAVFLQATGSGGSLYQSDQPNPPSITVTRGVFTGPSDGPNVLLPRVN